MMKSFLELYQWWKRNRVKDQQGVLDLHQKYRNVFGTPAGRDVLASICKNNFVWDSTFVPGDPYKTALREGQRYGALSILLYIEKEQQELTRNDETTP